MDHLLDLDDAEPVDHEPIDGMDDGEWFYFVHGYAVVPRSPAVVLTMTDEMQARGGSVDPAGLDQLVAVHEDDILELRSCDKEGGDVVGFFKIRVMDERDARVFLGQCFKLFF